MKLAYCPRLINILIFLCLLFQYVVLLPQTEWNHETFGLIPDYFKWTGNIYKKRGLLIVLRYNFTWCRIYLLMLCHIISGLHDMKAYTIDAAVMKGITLLQMLVSFDKINQDLQLSFEFLAVIFHEISFVD